MEQFPSNTRETSLRTYISSDHLNNQKLVNSKSAATGECNWLHPVQQKRRVANMFLCVCVAVCEAGAELPPCVKNWTIYLPSVYESEHIDDVWWWCRLSTHRFEQHGSVAIDATCFSPENTHMRSYTYDVLEMVMWTWTQTNICTLPDDLFMVCSRVKSADDEYIFYACHACTQHQQFIQKRLAKHRSKKRKKKRICGFHWILKMFVSIQFTDDRLVSCRCRTFAPLPLWKGDHFFFVYPYKWHCSLATRRHFF